MSEQLSEVPNDVLDAVDRALEKAVTTALAVSPSLSKPYPDDPRWTPYTRFMEPMAERALEARRALRAARETCS